MSILVVGGDNIEKISDELNRKGFDEINHYNGRKKGQRKFKISKKLDYVLILTDFLNHAMMENIRKRARIAEVPVLYSKRSLSSVKQTMDGLAC